MVYVAVRKIKKRPLHYKSIYDQPQNHCTKKFSIKDFFSKCNQIRSFQRIWSHLLNKSLIGNFIFCAVLTKISWPHLFEDVMDKRILH